MKTNKHLNLKALVPLCGMAATFLFGSTRSAQAQVVQNAAVPTTVYPQTSSVDIGPVLDVVGSVLADGYTINLTLIPTLTQFNGYDATPSVPIPAGTTMVPTVLPHFTVREVVTTVNVWDGQTVALGGLISESITKIKDRVPVLGDIPLLGSLFRSESKTSEKKNLMIFVTPVIIDQAGNKAHSEDEMPFASQFIPAQPPVPAQPAAQPQPKAQSSSTTGSASSSASKR
jgi:type II secretory pathway component GspD/PulD (secretin)